MKRLVSRAALGLFVTTVGCYGDLGGPTESVIVQDGGAADSAPLDAAAPAIAPGAPGANCTTNAQCTSAGNVCFIGNKASYCSMSCTAANAVTVCKISPFDGSCNMQGFCRRP